MRELSAVLVALIAIAEDIVKRNGMTQMAWRDLAAEIRHVHALPADGIRCTHAAMVMIELVEALAAELPYATDARPWVMLIAATLPILRTEAFRALCQENDARRAPVMERHR